MLGQMKSLKKQRNRSKSELGKNLFDQMRKFSEWTETNL